MARQWVQAAALAVLIGTALAVSSPVVAGEDEAIPSEKQAKWLARYPEMDADGDGTLTREEVRQFRRSRGARDRKEAAGGEAAAGKGKAGAEGRFRPGDSAKILAQHPEADTDGDGTLSPQERRAFLRSQAGEWKSRLLAEHPELDTNQDGTLSDEELKAGKVTIDQLRLQRMGDRILQEHPEADTDGDGKVSKEEFAAFRATRGGFGMAPPHQPVLLLDWLVGHFEEADLDGSGELSKDELLRLKEKYAGPGVGAFPPRAGRGASAPDRQGLLQRFPGADANGDGQLSDEELRALKAQRRDNKGPGPKGKGRTPTSKPS